nr:hypothetical protein [Mesorhizobium loti]
MGVTAAAAVISATATVQGIEKTAVPVNNMAEATVTVVRCNLNLAGGEPGTRPDKEKIR